MVFHHVTDVKNTGTTVTFRAYVDGIERDVLIDLRSMERIDLIEFAYGCEREAEHKGRIERMHARKGGFIAFTGEGVM